MRISLASSAELYAEHRRTASPRKRERIAAELQRRHDEQMGGDQWRVFGGYKWTGRFPPRRVEIWFPVRRFIFALWLP